MSTSRSTVGSSADDLTRVVAQAADAATEIFLVDSSLRRRARGVGRLEAYMPAGLYKLRYVAGSATIEELVEVPSATSGKAVTFRQEPMSFSTAAPLEHTLAAHEGQSKSAAILSRGSSVSIGSGSHLFLFIRDADVTPGRPFEQKPGKGVSVETLAGNQVATLDNFSTHDPKQGYAALRLEVDPDTYILSVDTRTWGVQQMAVTTCKGWQTQIFLCTHRFERRAGTAESGRSPVQAIRANLFAASISMARPQSGFEPSSEDARVSELARQALERGRNIMREGPLRQALLHGKFRDPMLGLYAAHLLLLDEPLDRGLLAEVIGNLERMGLGGHPDLGALYLLLGSLPEPAYGSDVFARPPSLRAGWRRIVEATAEFPDLIPDGSLAARIGPRVIGSAAWLVWRREGAASERRRKRRALRGGKRASQGLGEDLKVLLYRLARERDPRPEIAIRGEDDALAEPRQSETEATRIPYSSSPESLAKKALAKWHPKLGLLEQTVVEILTASLSGKRLTAAEALRELTRQTGLPAATLAPIVEDIVRKTERRTE